jgi:hypothetical protein
MQWPRRHARDSLAVGNVAEDDGTRANGNPGAYRKPFADTGAQADPRSVADAYIARYRRTGRHMYAFGDIAVMIDDCPRVDDAAATDTASRVQHAAGENHAAKSDGGMGADYRCRMPYDREREPQFGQFFKQVKALPGVADGNHGVTEFPLQFCRSTHALDHAQAEDACTRRGLVQQCDVGPLRLLHGGVSDHLGVPAGTEND